MYGQEAYARPQLAHISCCHKVHSQVEVTCNKPTSLIGPCLACADKVASHPGSELEYILVYIKNKRQETKNTLNLYMQSM